MHTPDSILDNHLGAFARGDLDAVLSDYAPDAVLFTPMGILKGPDEIRALIAKLIAEFAKPVSSFTLKYRASTHDHAYIIWSAETADNFYDFVTDTFTIRDGKIAAQSFAAVVRPKV